MSCLELSDLRFNDPNHSRNYRESCRFRIQSASSSPEYHPRRRRDSPTEYPRGTRGRAATRTRQLSRAPRYLPANDDNGRLPQTHSMLYEARRNAHYPCAEGKARPLAPKPRPTCLLLGLISHLPSLFFPFPGKVSSAGLMDKALASGTPTCSHVVGQQEIQGYRTTCGLSESLVELISKD